MIRLCSASRVISAGPSISSSGRPATASYASDSYPAVATRMPLVAPAAATAPASECAVAAPTGAPRIA